MSKEKYGFVYIWFDRKHKRYYIGCHWGTEDDGYICSSRWMKNAIHRRPQDFKRRILNRVYTNRNDMFNIEGKWLALVQPNELGKRYYNLNKTPVYHWSRDEFLLERQRKISSRVNKGIRRSPSTEFKPGECRSPETQFKKGIVPHNKGKKLEDVVGVNKATKIKQAKSDRQKGRSFSEDTQFKPGQTSGSNNPRACPIMTPYGRFDTQAEASKSLNITKASINYKIRSPHHPDWHTI